MLKLVISIFKLVVTVMHWDLATELLFNMELIS